MNYKSRAYCFTWNNYTDESLTILSELDCRYIIYGKEVAPGTGTPHLQGYVVWNHAKTCRASRSLLPGCHVSLARGNSLQNKEYCSKGGDSTERGDRPTTNGEKGDKEVARWSDALDNAKTGKLEEIPPDILIRHYSALKRIVTDYMPTVCPLAQTCGIWVYGDSGSGKTRTVMGKWPDSYVKPRNQWWDGYQLEPTVVCDDVDKFDVKLGGRFKHWADYLPFIAEVKGGSIKIRPEIFIVTSQYRIEEIWEDEQTRKALLRRFTVWEKKLGETLFFI